MKERETFRSLEQVSEPPNDRPEAKARVARATDARAWKRGVGRSSADAAPPPKEVKRLHDVEWGTEQSPVLVLRISMRISLDEALTGMRSSFLHPLQHPSPDNTPHTRHPRVCILMLSNVLGIGLPFMDPLSCGDIHLCSGDGGSGSGTDDEFIAQAPHWRQS